MIQPHRSHTLFLAFLLHRISGLLLALFLPVHFWVLSLTLTAPNEFDSMLAWSDNSFVKLAEFVLVFLLAVHIFGGLRLIALELLDWNSGQKTAAASAVAIAVFVSGIFLLRAI